MSHPKVCKLRTRLDMTGPGKFQVARHVYVITHDCMRNRTEITQSGLCSLCSEIGYKKSPDSRTYHQLQCNQFTTESHSSKTSSLDSSSARDQVTIR